MHQNRDFPGGPVVRNLPSTAGETGSIPDRGTRIPHAVGHLSPHTATTEPMHSRACAPQLDSLCAATIEAAHSGAGVPLLEKSPRIVTKSLRTATKT